MSKIVTHVQFKKNLGNYENIELFAGIEVDVDDPYDQEEWDKAWDKVDTEVSKQLSDVESHGK